MSLAFYLTLASFQGTASAVQVERPTRPNPPRSTKRERPATNRPGRATASPEALAAEGARYAEAGQWTKAASAYERLTQLRPKSQEAYLKLAEAEFHAERYDRSQRAASRALEIEESADARMWIARSLFEEGNPADARRLALFAMERYGRAAQATDFHYFLHVAADAALWLGEVETAAREYDEVVSLSSSNGIFGPLVVMWNIQSYLENDHPPEVELAILRRMKRHDDWLGDIGERLLILGYVDEAHGILVRASALEFPPNRGELGVAKFRLGDVDAAEGIFRQVLAAAPSSAASAAGKLDLSVLAHVGLAGVRAKQGRATDATFFLDEARRRSRGSLAMAEAYRLLGEPDKARRAATELDPKERVDRLRKLSFLGRLAFDGRDYGEAAARFEELARFLALAKDGHEVNLLGRTYFFLALSYLRSSQRDRALPVLQIAKERTPRWERRIFAAVSQ